MLEVPTGTFADALRLAEKVTATRVPGHYRLIGRDHGAEGYALAAPLRADDGVVRVEHAGEPVSYRLAEGMIWPLLGDGERPETITVHVLRREARA